MRELQTRLRGETIEFCLQTAHPITSTAFVQPYARSADRLHPALRPLPRHVDLVALLMAWRHVAQAIDRAECDVVLAHPCQYLQAPLALRWVSPRSVYFCHETRRVDYEQAIAATVNPSTRYLYAWLHDAERRLDRLGVASADCLLTNSRFTAARIEHAYGRTAEPVLLGVADVFREPAPDSPRTHLLSVGSLIESKGHELAIRTAAHTARRWPLVVVAPRSGPEEAARLEAIAEQSSIALEIRIGITDAALRDLYRGAVCTLYLAREEPLGLASMEAQACGSPVVVADEGGLPDTMIAGETGWVVEREDTRAAARAIDRLEDPMVKSTISACAREHGCAQTWGRSTAQVQEALERTCRKRARS
jgi:glycosyltransferase involved in cell wall biosynthesis